MRHWFGTFALTLTLASFSYSQDPAQILGALEPRELGPTTMGGRVSDIAVYEKDPRIFYIGTASGGVWKTENGGTALEPIFDKQPVLSIGAIAVNQKNPDEVWVGTGEPSSRNSTCYGDGLYHTMDGGKTWEYVGFKESRQCSRIVINPEDPKTVFVALLGNLWGPNPERGLYKTTDGGKTWKKVIEGGPKVGVIDVTFNPKNPKVMLAATWERLRVPYNFYSRSEANAIWRSTDGGEKWTKVSKGLPTGQVGRIGLSIMRSNPKICIATVDAEKDGGVYRSEDEGVSWTKMSATDPRPFYFSLPRQDPNDENRLYLGATGLMVSDDKGKTVKEMPIQVHPDFHALWINPSDSNHILVGNDGGCAQSRDRGKTWQFLGTMRIGQFYDVSVNNRKPYWIFGGAQDNGSWGGPTQTRNGGVSYYHWFSIGGGDGFYVEADPEDPNIVYSESQGGAVARLDLETGATTGIRPNPSRLGEPSGTRYRFNWDTPIMVSPHNHATVYIGGNKLFKSVDRGDHWKAVSPDLSTNDPEKQKPVLGDQIQSGAEVHCTIISISESPIKEGLLWVGTDDGLVQVSQDGGTTWKEVGANAPGVPKGTWVSRVCASRYKEGRCYVAFDGHRTNDYAPYVFVTEDFGTTWTRINGIPDGNSCYALTEGLKNEDLLFVGTELGLYASLDRGATWTKYTTSTFPNVRVDDMVIHPREFELAIATHGRSFWTVPVGPLEELTKANRDKDVFLCDPQDVTILGRLSGGGYTNFGEFVAQNTQPGTKVYYWLKAETKDKVVVSIQGPGGNELARLDGKGAAGLNSVSWRPRGRQAIGKTGDVSAVLKIGDKEVARTGIHVESLVGSGNPGSGEESEQVTDPDREIDPKSGH
ncbi:MAG: hypothetical protein JSS66_00340 [Armatimonadetes bacterium]|nr:hypothetical protein [Armatimonadota bacterium]